MHASWDGEHIVVCATFTSTAAGFCPSRASLQVRYRIQNMMVFDVG